MIRAVSKSKDYPKGSSKVQWKNDKKYEFEANLIITKKKFTESTLMQKTFLKPI